jgi:hypothetical protein
MMPGPGPAPAGDLGPDGPVSPSRPRGHDRLPGSPKLLVLHDLAEPLTPQQGGDIPHGYPGPGTPSQTRGRPCPLCPPRKRHGLPAAPVIRTTGPSLPAPARAGAHGMMPDTAARVKPGHAAQRGRPWPSAETPTVHTDRHTCAHRPS